MFDQTNMEYTELVTKQVCQETTTIATISPLFEPELTEIRVKLAEWDKTFGSTIISQWLFDVAFHRLYQANGFESANALLTQARYTLRRAEGPTSLGWLRRIKKQAKAEAQSKAEKLLQDSAEAA